MLVYDIVRSMLEIAQQVLNNFQNCLSRLLLALVIPRPVKLVYELVFVEAVESSASNCFISVDTKA